MRLTDCTLHWDTLRRAPRRGGAAAILNCLSSQAGDFNVIVTTMSVWTSKSRTEQLSKDGHGGHASISLLAAASIMNIKLAAILESTARNRLYRKTRGGRQAPGYIIRPNLRD